MKKLLTILLALLVVTGVVFATDEELPAQNATLTIYAENIGSVVHKITTAEVEDYSDWSSVGSITTKKEVEFDKLDAQSVGWYSIMSNMKDKKYDVTISADPLKNDGNYEVPYTLTVGTQSGSFANMGETVGGESNYVAGDAGAFTNIVLEAILGGSGLQFYSTEISITFDRDYTVYAEEGDYEADITFVITAN